MLKNESRKVAFVVILLLLILSLLISVFNFKTSLHSKEQELIERSLPLSIDNIYTEIQVHILDQNLISSMMANDTFLVDWLVNNEENESKIQQYLSSVKNKYQLFLTFLVSQKTQNYYTQDGLLEQLSPDNPDNIWYFEFREGAKGQEINLDFNHNIEDELIMFINHKIFDKNHQLLGVAGVGIKTSYLHNMLRNFRQNYQSTVFFVKADSTIVFSEEKALEGKSFLEQEQIQIFKNNDFSNVPKIVEYSNVGKDFIFMTRYVPDLNIYIVVKVKLSDFTGDVVQALLINILISLLITAIISFLILSMFTRYNRKLDLVVRTDGLTGLDNKVTFNGDLKKMLSFAKRHGKSLSVIFIDIDNFKAINDLKGHYAGDDVLVKVASILKKTIRESDLLARWGGEEFIVALIDSEQENSFEVAEKMRKNIESDNLLKQLVGNPITASFGLTTLKESDDQDSLFVRADKAMYQSKTSGKNHVSVL